MKIHDARRLLEGIRDANYHHDGIRCLRLLRLDAARFAALRTEIQHLCAQQVPSDVRNTRHVTNWAGPFGKVTQYSLYNATGRFDDFSSDHNASCFGKRFHHKVNFPELDGLMRTLPALINCRLNLMGPSAGLSMHEEHSVIKAQSGLVGIRARFHLPIVTNPLAEISLDGSVYHLEAGSIFFINHGCVHSAVNSGTATRIHLVWDLLLTRAACNLLFGDMADACPAHTIRVPSSQRCVTPVRTTAISNARVLPSSLSEPEAADLAFLRVQ